MTDQSDIDCDARFTDAGSDRKHVAPTSWTLVAAVIDRRVSVADRVLHKQPFDEFFQGHPGLR